MKDEEVSLPLEFKSGNDIPVTRAVISRSRMIEILKDVKQTSQDSKVVPLFPTDEIVRELKQQFGFKDEYGVMMWYTDFISRIAI